MTTSPSQGPLDQLLEHAWLIRFVLLAAFLFTSFFVVYNGYFYGSDLIIKYLELSANLSSWLLNHVFGMDTIVTEIRQDISTKILEHADSKVHVIVARGCDASTVFAVLIATVSAWPGKWRTKLPVIVVGLLLMYVLNLFRIVGMLLVEVHLPDHFDIFHEWILPNLLIVGALLYFYAWVRYSGEHPADSQTG